MYKLVAIDLDGTMLNSYGIVTENTKHAIKEAKQKGAKIIIASGRTAIPYLKNLAFEIDTEKYFIAGNGALIYDVEKDEILYKNYLTKDKILKAIQICEENSIYYSVYTQTSVITKSLNYNALYYYKENQKKEESKRTNLNIVNDVYKYIENTDEQDFMKIMICDDSKVVFDSIINKLRKTTDLEVLNVSHMSRKIIKQGTEEIALEYYCTEVSQGGVNKWNAIKKVAEKLNIKEEEIICIGDNANDTQMIKNAGLGIAVENSVQEAKDVADFITKDNNNDGVAFALKKFIL